MLRAGEGRRVDVRLAIESKELAVEIGGKTQYFAWPLTSQRRLAVIKAAGITPERLDALLAEAEGRKRGTVFRVTCRWRDEPADNGTLFDTFEEALEAPPSVPTGQGRSYEMSWQGLNDWAALDIDTAHGDEALRHVTGRSPVPAFTWRSHGGGARIMYRANDRLTAGECAAMMALALMSGDWATDARFEVLSRTSHPGVPRRTADGRLTHCGPVSKHGGGWNGHHPWTRNLGSDDVADTGIENWLAKRGMHVGGRFDHSKCPFDPHETSGSPPVQVEEDGIRCFRCQATGARHFATWPQLMGDVATSRALDAARHWVIWEHARHLLEDVAGIRCNDLVKRLAYSALAKALHEPGDPRHALLFPSSADRYIRGGGGIWLDPHTLTGVSPASPNFLRAYPSVYGVSDTNELALDVTLLARHTDTGTSPAGYAEIVPLRGARLWGLPQPDGRLRVSAPSRSRPSEHPARYITQDMRVPLEDCREAVAKWFPGLDWRYLRLLISARVWAESGAGPLPMIACEGVSGSGKSSTVRVAAVMCGDEAAKIDLSDKSKMDEAIGLAAEGAGFLLFDEFNKAPSARDKRARAEAMLDLTRLHSYRRLYYGPVTVPLNSAVVLTDIAFDEASFRRSMQIGRRFLYVRLPHRAPRWEEHCPTRELSGLRGEREAAKICDSIISYVADHCAGIGDWQQTARDLGFDTVETAFAELDESANTLPNAIRRLYRACHDSQQSPDGWLHLEGYHAPGMLAEAFRNVVPTPDVRAGGHFDLSVFAEHDLGALCLASEVAAQGVLEFQVDRPNAVGAFRLRFLQRLAHRADIVHVNGHVMAVE